MIANLKNVRKMRGMTQAQLASASGVNRITIARYEKLKLDPKTESAGKLAKALGVTVDDLMKEGSNGEAVDRG